jgi:osmotically-inducible protein OsmY
MRARCAAVLSICLAAAQTGCVSIGGCGLRECSADAKISADVRTLFAQNVELGGPNVISVQTVRGVVYLRGLVSTPYQIAEAGSIAAQAPGVAAVRNLVVIDNSK